MTTQEIYDEIIAEKESGNYPELAELNSTSKVSIWRLWVWIFAFSSRSVIELFGQLKTWVEDYFARKQVGTLLWWIDQVKAFQYGDSLQYIYGVWKYATIDTNKQIVQQVALELNKGLLYFKVAKIVNSELVALSTNEIVALKAYINKIKLAGQFINIVSYPADEIKLAFKIYYNAEFDTSALTLNVNAAIKTYLQNIVFNGELIITDIVDQLQQIDGIMNPIFVSGSFKNANMPEWFDLGDYYNAISGYLKANSVELEFVPYV